MAEPRRHWFGVYEPPGSVARKFGPFSAAPGRAFETMAKHWPTHAASGLMRLERDPEELAHEKQVARG